VYGVKSFTTEQNTTTSYDGTVSDCDAGLINQDLYEKLQHMQIQHLLLQNKKIISLIYLDYI